MHKSNLDIAEAYYSAVQSGDYEKMGSYLANDVKYSDPQWPLKGKDQVWPIANSFSAAVNRLKTEAKFTNNDHQVMLVHDVLFHKSDRPMKTAVLMSFDQGRIKEIELFADTSQHLEICRHIFTHPIQP
jgi:ketosteroid isomerase-like protein